MDELIAVLFENAGIRLMGDEALREHALYEEQYAALGVRVWPEAWALDSFRSIDCMTIGAYALGQRLADALPARIDWPAVLRVAVRAAAEGAGVMDLFEKVREAGGIQ